MHLDAGRNLHLARIGPTVTILSPCNFRRRRLFRPATSRRRRHRQVPNPTRGGRPCKGATLPPGRQRGSAESGHRTGKQPRLRVGRLSGESRSMAYSSGGHYLGWCRQKLFEFAILAAFVDHLAANQRGVHPGGDLERIARQDHPGRRLCPARWNGLFIDAQKLGGTQRDRFERLRQPARRTSPPVAA